jgi:hypothetical protein
VQVAHKKNKIVENILLDFSIAIWYNNYSERETKPAPTE